MIPCSDHREQAATRPAPDVRVQPAAIDLPTPADAEELGRVHNTGWAEAYGDLLPDRFWDEAALAQRVRTWELITRWHPQKVLDRARIARGEEGTPVGFLLIGPVRDPEPVRDVELQALYVTSPWYSTGTGRALVEELLGDRPASLWVAERNYRARRFYEKMGFGADGARTVDPDLEDLAEIRMVR